MPMTPSSSPMSPPTTTAPSPETVPDMASPPMMPGMDSSPSPGPMPPAMASPDSGAFNGKTGFDRSSKGLLLRT
ncbi:hypothetical protein Bca52824_075499 [Brassica carinata]|uniref:Uncharacterized protein n=1 Tax=Brassica carinata TaxID=52824 RepID=A0A8X7PRC5_BRACI|nr:hypothetical protein Bca52824_075499 [Brassica carinata]